MNRGSIAERTGQALQVARLSFIESDPKTWSDADYQRLLAEFSALFNTLEGAPEEARYDALADLIEDYEEQRYHIAEWLKGGEAARPEAISGAEQAQRQTGQPERKLVTV